MKVFYDHTIFQQPYGGISRYFCELIRRLSRKSNLDISVFMGLFLNQYKLEHCRDCFGSYWGHSVPLIPYSGPLRRFVNEGLWRIFQMRASPLKGQDCIYHPTYYSFSGLPEAKTVFTVYDFAHERFKSLFPGDRTPAMKKKAFEGANVLICISESTKRDLLELYTINSACQVRVVHLGYNNLAELPEVSVALPDRPYFLFVGPRHAYKNFECLAKAFASRRKFKKDFSLVCFGGSAFSPKELDLFSSLELSDKIVHFSGGDGLLGTLYKKAVALVYPSLYEGFGIPILEAMNCECPVIACNTSSIPEVAGDAACLFDAGSPEALAEALAEIAFNDRRRAELVIAGKQRCRLFSWDRCAEETLALYTELSEH